MRILYILLTAVLLAGLAVIPGCTRSNEAAEVFAEDGDVAVETTDTPEDGDFVTDALTAPDFTDIEAGAVTLKPDDYIQQPPITFSPYIPVEARGVYITSNSAGLPDRLESLIGVCEESGMNAVVIDIRTENEITMKNWIDFADEWGVSKNFIPDAAAVITRLKESDIYTIARMVTFLDGYTVDYRPELYIHNKDGSIWMGPKHNGNKRYPWLNPYNKETWDYVLTYAKAAAELGFDEIQFDYVRFAATSTLEDADFGETGGLSRTEAILAFVQYAVDELKPYGVKVSADVYGTIINSDLDASIVGQDYTALSRILDAICPMIYPSHFAIGTYGVSYPDMQPYDMVYNALLKSAERLADIPEGEHRAVVRPWLQDFTASYLKPHYINYGSEEREAQIQAVYDAGLSEWLLWDAGNRYEAEGVLMIDHD